MLPSAVVASAVAVGLTDGVIPEAGGGEFGAATKFNRKGFCRGQLPIRPFGGFRNRIDPGFLAPEKPAGRERVNSANCEANLRRPCIASCAANPSFT
jgi:hypothetical protein